MLKYYNYDIVCQEIPDEITLAINISNCPNKCPGCHSPWLWEDQGEELNCHSLKLILEKYSKAVTCVCFMGGDREPKAVEQLSIFVKTNYPTLNTAWYSGKEMFPDSFDYKAFNYVKLGGYVQSLGGLRSATTNQRLFRVEDDKSLHRIAFL